RYLSRQPGGLSWFDETPTPVPGQVDCPIGVDVEGNPCIVWPAWSDTLTSGKRWLLVKNLEDRFYGADATYSIDIRVLSPAQTLLPRRERRAADRRGAGHVVHGGDRLDAGAGLLRDDALHELRDRGDRGVTAADTG